MSMRISTFPGGAADSITGERRIINVAAPGAGNEWSLTFGAGFFWRLLCGQSTFTASAAVANRFPGIQISDGNVNLATIDTQAAIVATTVATVTYVPTYATIETAASAPNVVVGVPPIWFEAGFIIRSSTVGRDVGDTYTLINLWFEALDYGAYG